MASPCGEYIADARRRDPQSQRERVCGKAERLHEFLAENLARVGADARHKPAPSMIINDLDELGTALAPDEADTPPVVDPMLC